MIARVLLGVTATLAVSCAVLWWLLEARTADLESARQAIEVREAQIDQMREAARVHRAHIERLQARDLEYDALREQISGGDYATDDLDPSLRDAVRFLRR